MATFTFKEVPPETCNFAPTLIQQCLKEDYFDPKLDIIIATSNERADACTPAFGNGLIGTIFRAYSEHVPLVLRPDDVWTAILAGFSLYVQKHPEEMRAHIVEHQGRKSLTVQCDEPSPDCMAPRDWERFISKAAEQIRANSKASTLDWMIPAFSTTTDLDRAVANVALMSTTRDYFSLRFEMACGLSQVTLLGTEMDWFVLYDKCNELKKFGIDALSKWSDMLRQVLIEFSKTRHGDVDANFWQRICTLVYRGSGGQHAVKGWVLVFAPFDEYGEFMLKQQHPIGENFVFEYDRQVRAKERTRNYIFAEVADDAIQASTFDVPITIIDPNGVEHPHKFCAGLLRTIYNREQNFLTTAPEWILIRKKEIHVGDFVRRVEECVQQRGTHKQVTNEFMLFAFHTAKFFGVPNDELLEFARLTATVICCDGNQSMDDYMSWLESMANPIIGCINANNASKYMVRDKFADVIKAFQH